MRNYPAPHLPAHTARREAFLLPRWLEITPLECSYRDNRIGACTERTTTSSQLPLVARVPAGLARAGDSPSARLGKLHAVHTVSPLIRDGRERSNSNHRDLFFRSRAPRVPETFPRLPRLFFLSFFLFFSFLFRYARRSRRVGDRRRARRRAFIDHRVCQRARHGHERGILSTVDRVIARISALDCDGRD